MDALVAVQSQNQTVPVRGPAFTICQRRRPDKNLTRGSQPSIANIVRQRLFGLSGVDFSATGVRRCLYLRSQELKFHEFELIGKQVGKL
jgi:hypothetical protein